MEAVDDHFFIGQHPDAGADERFVVLSGVAKLIVVAGSVIDAEGQAQLIEGSNEPVRVALESIKDVAGQKGDIRAQAGCDGHHATTEFVTVYVTQMQVTEYQGGAASPLLGQVGEFDCHAPDANPAGIEQAIEADKNGQGKEDAGNKGPDVGRVEVQSGKQQREPDQPTEAGCPKNIVEKPQPDGRNFVNERDNRVGEAKAEQRGNDEAEGQKKKRDAQLQSSCRTERLPKDNPGVIDEQMGKQQESLHY